MKNINVNANTVYSNPVIGGGVIPWLYAPLTSGLTLTYGTGTLSVTRASTGSGKGSYYYPSDLSKQGQLSGSEFSKDAWDALLYSGVTIKAADGTYQMFYNGYEADGVLHGPCYATSPDLVTWTKPNLGQITYDGNTNNNILIAYTVYDVVDVVVINGTYVLVLLNGGNNIQLYTSPDGVTWSSLGIVIDLSGLGYTLEAKCLLYIDGVYRIFYSRNHETQRRSIGYYESATLDGSYTDQGLIPEFTSGTATLQYYDMFTWVYDGTLWASIPKYNSVSDVLGPIMLYRSNNNGATWQPSGNIVENGGSGEFDENLIANTKPIIGPDGTWHTVYVGSTQTHANWPRTMEFGRSTGGTTDADLIDFVPVNEARYWGDDGVLVEMERYNFLPQSRTMQTTWSPTNASVDAEAAVAPDGAIAMIRMKPDTSTGSHRLWSGNTFTTVSGSTYTFSCFMKDDGARFVGLSNTEGAEAFISVLADLQLGTIVATDVGTSSGTIVDTGIKDWGNGIYEVWITGSHTGAGSVNVYIYTSDSASPTFDAVGMVSHTGVTGNDVFLWGARYELGAYRTAVIWNTAAATRNADVLELDQAPPNNDFTVELDWTPLEDTGATEYIWSSYLDANNYLRLYYDGTDVIFDKTIGGTTYDANYTIDIDLGTTYTLKGELSSVDGVQVYVDGAAGTLDANTTDAVVGTTTQLGADGNDANQTAMAVKNLKIIEIAIPGYTASIYQGQKTTSATLRTENIATGVTATSVESDAGTGVVTIYIDGAEDFTVADSATAIQFISGSTIGWLSDNTGTIQLGQGVLTYVASIYQAQKTTSTTARTENLATGVTAVRVQSDAGTGLVTVLIDGVEDFTVADGATRSRVVSGSTITWSSANTGTIQLGQGIV